MKRIVIFADGTWNSPEEENPTNVLKIARGVKPVSKKVEQVSFYDWGVGADSKKISGGISGLGIDKNIMDCYRFIVHNYRPGDHLYFFGFSRGAYTVRSLAGLIRNSGLLKREYAHLIEDAYKLYRQRTPSSRPNQEKSKKFRGKYAYADVTKIEFVGVWDTVGAAGVPVPFLGVLGEKYFAFHDTQPSRIIKHARHAVSIDENREDFEPSLWTSRPGFDLKQVWFSGIHSDIGGGYKDQRLGDISLQWMVKEAHAFGLEFESHLKKKLNPSSKGALHNERKDLYLLRKEIIREIKGPLHRSVKERWDANTQNYKKKSKAMQQLLQSVDNDWSNIEVVK